MGILFNNEVQATPLGVDMDNAGNHIIRDDDGEKDADGNLLYSHSVFKKLWVYNNSVENADSLRLWIYGKIYDQAPDAITHEIYINDLLVSEIKAREYFVPGYFTWASVLLDVRDVVIGACNLIEIRSVYDSCTLAIGIDRDFTTLGNQNLFDFDRSYADTVPLATNFIGEWMIYLEFIRINSELSEGYTNENTNDYISLRNNSYPLNWDSAGYILDWSSMSEEEFNAIYLVRLWVYCRPSGTFDSNEDDVIWIIINTNHSIEQFNPYKRLPRTWSWLALDIHNMGDSTNNYLGNIENTINIKDVDQDNTTNNLDISIIQDSMPDNDKTWWYLKTGDSTYEGAFEDPEDDDCDEELAMYIQVFYSDSWDDPETTDIYSIGCAYNVDNRAGDFDGDGYDSDNPNNLIDEFDNYGFWGSSNWIDGHESCQWTIYGEQRSPTDVNAGDLVDFFAYYGPGQADTLALVQLRIDGGNWYLDDVCFHDNDDYTSFTATGTSMTEAEGNDDDNQQYEVEDDGSNGYDFDCEWVFLFSPNVFNNGINSRFQTMLWHRAHGVYGFQEISVDDINNILDSAVPNHSISWYLRYNSIIDAWDAVCDYNDVTGYYFYNSDCDDDWLWGNGPGGGPPVGAEPDSLDRTNINYADTGV